MATEQTAVKALKKQVEAAARQGREWRDEVLIWQQRSQAASEAVAAMKADMQAAAEEAQRAKEEVIRQRLASVTSKVSHELAEKEVARGGIMGFAELSRDVEEAMKDRMRLLDRMYIELSAAGESASFVALVLVVMKAACQQAYPKLSMLIQPGMISAAESVHALKGMEEELQVHATRLVLCGMHGGRIIGLREAGRVFREHMAGYVSSC